MFIVFRDDTVAQLHVMVLRTGFEFQHIENRKTFVTIYG